MIVRGVVSYFLRLAHLKPLNLGFSEMPLVSISNGQRRPIAKANFVATVHQRHSHELAHANRRGGYVAFLRRIRASTARHRSSQPAAHPLGSLTPADAPLIDAEKLFKQSGPPHCSS